MSEIISIKLKINESLAEQLKILSDNYNIDKDVIDLTPGNINLIMSVDEAEELGKTMVDLIYMLSKIKEKTHSVKN